MEGKLIVEVKQKGGGAEVSGSSELYHVGSMDKLILVHMVMKLVNFTPVDSMILTMAISTDHWPDDGLEGTEINMSQLGKIKEEKDL